jgi:hypothetical protein
MHPDVFYDMLADHDLVGVARRLDELADRVDYLETLVRADLPRGEFVDSDEGWVVRLKHRREGEPGQHVLIERHDGGIQHAVLDAPAADGCWTFTKATADGTRWRPNRRQR